MNNTFFLNTSDSAINKYFPYKKSVDIIQYDIFSMCDIFFIPQRLEQNRHCRPPR